MAGSYKHCVNDDGQLYNNENLHDMLGTFGDVDETIEELYGMVWFLAEGDPVRVEEARQYYGRGIMMSPGREPE